MSLGHPDWIGACGAYLSGLEASSRRGLVVTVFYGAVFLRGTTSGAVLVLLVVVSGSLEDRVRADRRFGRPAHLTKRLVYEVGISRSRVIVKAPSPAALIFASRIFARVGHI